MTRPNVILHDIGAKINTYFSDTKYEILDPVSNEALEYWESHHPTSLNYPAQGIAFRPDGGRVYCVTHSLETSSGELEVHAGSGAWDRNGISAGNFNARIGSLNLDYQIPKSIVPSPDGSKVYIPCSATNKVITVDVTVDSSPVIINELNVGSTPWGCAITPDGTKLYITNMGSNDVSVINTITNNVIYSIPAGNAPRGIAINPAGTLAYVANSGSNSISVIDLASDIVIRTITVGSLPYWLIFTPNGKYAFITNNESGTVSVIDAGIHEVIYSLPVGLHPEGICVYPDGSKVYVATDLTAWIIRTSDMSVSSIDNTTVYKSKKNVVAVANSTSRIAGRVQNGNQLPVANAIVKAFSEGIEKGTAETNASGDYSICNLKKGTYDIEVSAPHYASMSLNSQSVGAGRIKVCHFHLVSSLPTVTTTDVSEITSSNAKGGGNITADGGFAVTDRGVCWSTSTDPTISDSKTSDGTGTGSFVSNITGFLPDITYYVRAYATNSEGTAYGENVPFSTTITSIIDFAEAGMKVYPNPNEGICFIESVNDYSGKIRIDLIDITGKAVRTYNFFKAANSFKEQIDFKDARPGFFILQIQSRSKVFKKCIIKYK
jgi:YVTN family beta-propeller protein